MREPYATLFPKLPRQTQVMIELLIQLLSHQYTGKVKMDCHKGTIARFRNEP